MKIFKNLIKHWTNLIKTLSPEDKQQLAEIKKLEQQIQKHKETEKIDNLWFTPTNRVMFKFWFFAMIAVFLGYILFKSLDVIYLILTAYIISIAIEVVVDLFERMNISRWISITLTYILLVIFLLSGFVLIAPFLLNQITEIINIFIVKLNTLQTSLQTKGLVEVLKSSGLLSHYVQQEIFHDFSDPALVQSIQVKIQTSISKISSMWTSYAQSIGNLAVSFVSGLFSFIVNWSIVLTLAVLFSIEKVSVIKFIASLWWEKKYKYIYVKLQKIYKQLWIWLKSRLLLSLYVAIAMYASLWILSAFGIDLNSKASLAIILWLLDIVPYIGPVVGWIPAVLAWTTDYGIWAWVIITWVIFLINTLEANIMTPVLMNKSLGVNTVVIFICMILWGLIMGVTWILLAVPIAAIITLLFEKDYDKQ